MQPSIFISRDRSRSQDFTDIIESVSDRITCESLIDFSMISGGDLPEEGWLFFYSQTGVDYFLKQYGVNQIESNGLSVAAFGPKTGQYMQSCSMQIDFIGSGEAKATADLFLMKYQVSNVCFIKGTTSKDSLSPLLKNETSVTSIEVYNNKGKSNLELPESDILVFTSPLNLETYYYHYPVLPNQKVVVIGTSTALSALDLGIEEVHISSLPSLESLAAIVVELCATWSSAK